MYQLGQNIKCFYNMGGITQEMQTDVRFYSSFTGSILMPSKLAELGLFLLPI